MSTLYIRLPSKAAADSVPDWLALPCPYAQASNGGAIGRQGEAPLPDLSGAIATAQRVVVVLAASDVSLLHVKLPPLSASRLKTALPSLAEDQLITDPADCVMVAGDLSDGLRTIAVVQRAWLDTLAKTLISFGARRFAALPAQLCLPYQSGEAAAAINELDTGKQVADIDLILRLSEQEGIGLAIRTDQHGSAAQEVIRTLCTVVPEVPIALYVPQSSVRAYQDAVTQTGGMNERVSVLADNWSRWISGASSTTLDLMAGMGAGAGSVLDWRAWRWPLILAAVLLVINATALNFEWWRMKHESDTLRAAMIQVYKSAYPREIVIIDPIAQMRQKIAAAKHDSGMAAPDDFTMITAAFGEAWAKGMPAASKAASSTITALEYREHSLYVRIKPIGEASTQMMRTALAERNLSLDLLPEQSSMAVWQIRSTK